MTGATQDSTFHKSARRRFLHCLALIGAIAATFSLSGCTGAALGKSSAEPSDGKLKISSTTVPAAVVQNAYAANLGATGGEPPYTWEVSGQLPSGLAFDPQSGAISGTPNSVGTFPIDTTVRDAKADSVSEHFMLTVGAKASRVEIVGVALPAATAQTNYVADLSATGGVDPYSWSITSGTLPAGVTLNASTGALTGTPAAAGTFPFIATVRDAKFVSNSAGFAISVAAKPTTPTTPTSPASPSAPTAPTSPAAPASTPLQITTSVLPAGTAKISYSLQLQASGGTSPYVWGILAGSLPNGLALDSRAGTISGTPSTAGTFPLTIAVQDSKSASATEKLSLVIAAGKPTSNPPAPAPLKIITASLPVGTATQAYSATIAASGGAAPYTWAVSGSQLPVGLSLNSSTGAITGTPATAGKFSININVKDSKSASASDTFSLSISTELAPSISSISPNSTSNSGSTNVVITGTNFSSGATVQFGSVSAAAVQVSSAGQIQVTIRSQSAGKVNVTVKNTDGQVATANNAFTFIGPAPATPPPPAPSANLQPATSADSFVDSTGINIHLHFTNTPYSNFPAVKTALQNLGVRHIRDGLIDTTWTTYYDELNQLGQAGIKATLTTSIGQSSALLVSYPSRVASSFEAYEAPNEMDLSGNANWASNLNSFFGTLHSAVNSSSQVSQYPIVGPSLTQQSSYPLVGSSAPDFTDSNIHDYPGGHNPGTPGWGSGGYGSIAWNIAQTTSAWLNKPVIATETGYVTDVNQTSGVPEDVAGKYMPRVFLEQWLNGIKRTYIYELLDVGPNAGDNNYGLLHSDFSPKPAYTAVKNLLNLLSDPGPSFTPAGLDYTLSGNLTNVHHLLLQKRDGTSYLLLWVELPSYDVNTKQEISVAAQQVTVATGQAVRTNAYTWDITGNMNTSTLGVGQTQTIQVSDMVTVLEISQ
jgi:putative Ig domain-containing protein/IPT/TIG domain-containing protein